MCSISASFDKDKLIELAQLNEYRGQYSHSIFVVDIKTNKIIYQHRGLGALDINNHTLPPGYIIAHQQAPTGVKDIKNVHPAEIDNNYLWHNGIIKMDCVRKLQNDLETDEAWDTKLLLQMLMEFGIPNDINGTFAGIWIRPPYRANYTQNRIFVFRNEISPLFMDKDMNISSTKFSNSYSINANVMYKIKLKDKYIIDSDVFSTVENPYYGVL
tara:strand:- start:564 stop:1205 length:642 start_codon:yes stop_codon:yes gene_type:complete